MGAALTPGERRLVRLLALVTVTGSLWHIAGDLRPPPPPVEILRGALSPDRGGETPLHESDLPAVFPLDVASADSAALTLLPGIGPVLAGRIVAWREARGGIRDPEELIEVSGIGPVVMARIRPLVAEATMVTGAVPDSLLEARRDSLAGLPPRSGEWR